MTSMTTGFFEGGARSLSFGKVGSPEAAAVYGKWRGGVIEHIAEERQQTNWETQELEFWKKSGDPVMQLPVTLNTAAGQFPEPPVDGDDDGIRTLFITKGKQEFRAARDAIRKAGVKDIAIGGQLYVRWYSGVGISGDPRLHEFLYYPPQPGSNGFLDGGDQPAAPQQPPTQQPPQAPAQGSPMPPQVPAGQPQQWSAPAGQPGPIANTPQQAMAYGSAPAAVNGGQEPPQFDPRTGQRLTSAQSVAPPAQPDPPAFDPATGAPLNEAARAVLAQHAQAAPQAPPQQMPAQQPAPPANQAPVNPYAV
jgi:hypothetical protein